MPLRQVGQLLEQVFAAKPVLAPERDLVPPEQSRGAVGPGPAQAVQHVRDANVLEARAVTRPATLDRLRDMHGRDQEPRPPATLMRCAISLPGHQIGHAEGGRQHGQRR